MVTWWTGGILTLRKGKQITQIEDIFNFGIRYLRRAECIIGQYSNYTIEDTTEDELTVNGINTQVSKKMTTVGCILNMFPGGEYCRQWRHQGGIQGLL